MADGRKDIKNHLAAARDWLGDAENSLDRREDVKSELSIMLAEAELSRVREKSPSGLRHKLKTFGPILAAVALAVGVWLLLPRSEQTAANTGTPVVPAERAAAEQGAVEQKRDKVPAVTKPQPPVKPTVSAPAIAVPAAPKVPVSENKIAPSEGRSVPEDAAMAADRAAAVSVPPTIPAADMQRLMQDAGRRLRAQ